MNRFSSLLIFIGSLCLFTTCQEPMLGERISEGTIHYEISYPYPDQIPGLSFVLPKEMKVKFKGEKLRNEITAGMGFVRITTISQKPFEELTHLVQISPKRYVVDLDNDGTKNMLKLYPSYTIEHLDETKEIAGYTCKAVKATFKNDTSLSFKAYYTPKIESPSPNWFTPFFMIDGMMMEYEMTKFDLQMLVRATKVTNESVEPSEFERPEGYTPIGYEQVEKILHSMLHAG